MTPTRAEDLDFVLATERDPENRPYILGWSRRRHLRAIEDPDHAHWLVQTGGERRPVGYAILAGIESPHRSVELIRMAITEKGLGLGRQALRLVKWQAFDELGAHRLWLDVMEHNHRARSLYLSEGFRVEGRCREALLLDGHFVSLDLLSILEPEHTKLVATADAGDERRQERTDPSAGGRQLGDRTRGEAFP